jgi:hypothetical protein
MDTVKMGQVFVLIAASMATSITAFASGSHNNENDRLSIGNGYFESFVKTNKSGEPKVIGIKFPESTLENLPEAEDTDGSTCFDIDSNDEIDLETECVGGHARTLYFESNLSPIKNITINWEPHGHIPADVYDKAHFDFHFYMISDIERKQITTGPCMPGLINCTQLVTAIEPVPAQYVHPDFFNTGLAFSHMGNHYVDGTSPEFNGGIFTHTFILGSFASHITFYEPMVSLAYLQSKPDSCHVIKQPDAFEIAGYYPTEYCIRYNNHRKTYTVTLEDFEYQVAQ